MLRYLRLSSILTSNPPFIHGLRFNGQVLEDNQTTIAEILKVNGYKTAAFVGGSHLNLYSGLDQGYELFDYPGPDRRDINYAQYTRLANETTRLALDWLNDNLDEKFHLFLHYFDPHASYEPPREFDIFQTDTPVSLAEWNAQRYDGEIRYVDYEIGKVIDLLEKEGMMNKTVVIVTADHGEAFGEHKYFFDHGDLLYEHQIHIPLIIYDKGITDRNDKLSLNTQIMPTALEILGINDHYYNAPSLFDERSLPALIFESDRCISPAVNNNSCHPVNDTRGKLIAARIGDMKYIYTPQKDGFKEELYDLSKDPDELKDKVNDRKKRLIKDELAEEVFKVMDMVHNESGNYFNIDMASQDILRSLGYVI